MNKSRRTSAIKRKRIPSKLWGRWATAVTLSLSLLAGIITSESAKAEKNEPFHIPESLSKYTTDLTDAAEQGRFGPIEERSKETSQLIQILASHRQNNPVVISDSQAVRDVLIVGVAKRIALDHVPEELRGSRLYKLNTDALFHDSKTSESLLTNLSAVLADLAKSNTKSILIIDPIQSLIGPSSAFDGAASALLRDALQNGQVQCLGASTAVAFDQNVSSDQSLAALFSKVETEAAISTTDATAAANQNVTEKFVGDKVSPDLREMLSSGNAPAHVKAILQVADVDNQALRHELDEYGIRIGSQLPRFGALAVDVPTRVINNLASNPKLLHLSLDRPVKSDGHIENTTGETTMWSEGGNAGFDGTGIGIAIIDSGIAPKIGGLDNIVLNQDFTGEGITGDPFGHGTFVASMAAANKGSYGGLAPGAKLINFRVLNSNGTGTQSGVLAALDAVLVNRAKYNIRVVNMSLGMPAVDSYQNDPVCRAVRSLVDEGIVVVAAAGNDGKDSNGTKIYGRIHSPGNEPSAITVGAVNTFGTDARNDDAITSYSSRGPTRSFWTDQAGVKHYDNLIKPDLSAPGNRIVGNAAPNNNLLRGNGSLSVPGKGNLMRLSGTSVAAPLAAGAAAVLLKANPSLTPNMIKMILMYTAQPLAGFNMFEQGAGELNIEGAIRLAKLVRNNLTSVTPVGSPLLNGPAPGPQTTIAGQTFQWSQGVLFKYDWATGTELITAYQGIYALGVLISDGVLVSDGVLISDGTLLSAGVIISDNIIISSGGNMGNGNVLFSSGVLVSDGVLSGDGVIISDGVITGDGVLASDALTGNGVMTADGTMGADNADSGDDTAAMALE